MPALDDEKMAIADVYAEALLAAAREQNAEDEVAAEFADLIAYCDRDPAFESFMTAASIDDDPRRASLEKLFRGRMNDLLLNLLQILNDRFRLPLLRAVQRCVQLRIEEERNQQEVLVETPMPLPPRLQEMVRRVASQHIGKEAILIEQLRPELIGGIVLRIGDIQIDASVAARINGLRKRLVDRTTLEIDKHRREMMEL